MTEEEFRSRDDRIKPPLPAGVEDTPEIRERIQRDLTSQFDYMAECDKTCSTVFRPQNVELSDLRHVLMGVIGFANDMNLIKKLMFRGRTREELNFPPATHPTAETLIEGLTAINAWSPSDIDILHGAIGVITEAGEVAEFLLKWAEGNKFDRVNVMEESGDVSWYVVRMLRGIGLTLEQSNRANIDKLHGRGHGQGFDVFADANRDLNAEHQRLSEDFLKGVDVVKNPSFDELLSRLDDEPTKAQQSKDLNVEIHAQGVAHAKAELGEMVDRIKATDVRPVPPGGVRG